MHIHVLRLLLRVLRTQHLHIHVLRVAPQQAARNIGIVERMAHAKDFLVGLVALAGDEHHVVGAGHADRLGDGLAAVALHDGARRMFQPGHDVGRDGIAILATRVVVGHDHHVGAALGDQRHLRTLAGIALAAATEHADQLADGVRAQRCQGLFQRVRRVRVVDHHQWQTPAVFRHAAAQAVHAAIDRMQL